MSCIIYDYSFAFDVLVIGIASSQIIELTFKISHKARFYLFKFCHCHKENIPNGMALQVSNTRVNKERAIYPIQTIYLLDKAYLCQV